MPMSGAFVPSAGPRSCAAAAPIMTPSARVDAAIFLSMVSSLYSGRAQPVTLRRRDQGQVAQYLVLRIGAGGELGLQRQQGLGEPRLVPEPFLAHCRRARPG